MANNTWTILDLAAGEHRETLEIGPADVSGTPSDWNVSARRLRGGLAEGVDAVEVHNGRLKFTVLPTRGMGIWRAWIDDWMLGWKSPVRGPVHPAYVPLMEPGGLGWLDGFDELMVRCGMESNGAPDFDANGRLAYPLHGKVANRPAHHVEVAVDADAGEITVRGVVEESRFHFQKLRLTTAITTRFGEPSITWHDEIQNLGGKPAGIQMLYHTNLGEPLLDARAQLVAPVAQVAPQNADGAKYGTANWHSNPPHDVNSPEQVYLFELRGDEQNRSRVMLQNSAGTRGVSLAFSLRELPWFTQWRNTAASEDGYVMGIEPGTNFPNPRTFEAEHGRVVELAPGRV